jgi:hypothetical protein
VLLVSDLADAPSDVPALKKELVTAAREGIELRVLALPSAYPTDVVRFRRLLGAQAIQRSVPAPPAQPHLDDSQRAGFPLALAIAAALVAGVLAANELVGVSLRWRRESA